MKLIKEIRSKEGILHFKRWEILKTKWFSIYLHGIYSEDKDKHLHNHPWDYTSIVIKGRYIEQTTDGTNKLYPGKLVSRNGLDYHKILKLETKSVYTLFFVSPIKRHWGYLVDGEWVHNETYRNKKHMVIMTIEDLFRESIKEIKSKWKLPKSGFLAGGAVSNLIWEKKTGNKAIINDLDIYHLDELLDEVQEQDFKNKQSFRKKEKIVFEDYTGLNINFKTSSFYTIENVDSNGIFNNIYYKSNTTDPFIIIDSFDINCCQAGYDIESDKFYWTKEFEEFLETGEIRIVSLNSPAHTAMRLVKKKIDLNAELPEIELDIIAYTLNNEKFIDTIKHRFKDRYANLFETYKSYLESRFELIRDLDLEAHLKSTLGIDERLWTLKSKVNGFEICQSQKIGVNHSKDFLFWVREFFGNEKLERIWYYLHLIIEPKLGLKNYLDCDIQDEDLNFLNRLVLYAPKSVKFLLGFSLSRQLYIVKKLFETFSHDPIIAICILETYKIENIDIENDLELLLLELAVRKNILEDPQGKVGKIIYNTHTVVIQEEVNLPF